MGGLDISYAGAAGAGLLSFLSPCVLPLVPAYLCFVAGTTLDRLVSEDGVDPAITRRVFVSALAFVIGFSTVFIIMGASASALNRIIIDNIDIIGKVAGAVIVLFGLHYMGLLKIPLLYREARINTVERTTSILGAYVIGLAFAFGWTPCVGPILATILTVRSEEHTSELQSLMRISYAVFCLKKKTNNKRKN